VRRFTQKTGNYDNKRKSIEAEDVQVPFCSNWDLPIQICNKETDEMFPKCVFNEGVGSDTGEREFRY
jgi:hypothetical protein